GQASEHDHGGARDVMRKLVQPLVEIPWKLNEAQRVISLGVLWQKQLLFMVRLRICAVSGCVEPRTLMRLDLRLRFFKTALQCISFVVFFLEICFQMFHLPAQFAHLLFAFSSAGY